MGQKRGKGGGRVPGKERDSQLIFLLCLSFSFCLCLCVLSVFSLTLSFIFLSVSCTHTGTHTLPHTPSSLLASGLSPGSFPLPGRLALLWAAAQGLVVLRCLSGSGPGTEAKQEPLSVGRKGQRARTQQEGPRLNLAERFGFQRLGMLNVLLLNVFLFLFTRWYLLLSRVTKRHSVKSKEVMEECINPHRL